MRAEGWRVMNIGPLTQALIKRFLQRLAATLYYHRNKERFVGVVYYLPQSSYDPAFDVQMFNRMLEFTPEVVATNRNTKDLSKQFTFWSSYSENPGLFQAVVGFSPQLIYGLFAFTPAAISSLNNLRLSSGQLELPSQPNTIHLMTRLPAD